MYVLVMIGLLALAVGWFIFRMVKNKQENQEAADLQREQEWADDDSVEYDEDDR